MEGEAVEDGGDHRQLGMSPIGVRIQMLDGFNSGFVDFEPGGTEHRRGPTPFARVATHLVGWRNVVISCDLARESASFALRCRRSFPPTLAAHASLSQPALIRYDRTMRSVSLRALARYSTFGLIVGTSALHCAPETDDEGELGTTSAALSTPTGASWIVLPRPPARTSSVFGDDWASPFTGSGATTARVASPKSDGTHALSVTLGAAGAALAATVDPTTAAFAGEGQTELSFAFNAGASVHAGIASLQVAVDDDDAATTPVWTTLKPYLTTGTVAANTWYQVTIPMSVLNPGNGAIRRLLVGKSTSAGATFVVDNVRFSWTDPAPTETLVYGDARGTDFVIDGWDSKTATSTYRTTGANAIMGTYSAAWSAVSFTHDWSLPEYPAGTHTTVSFDISGGSGTPPTAMKSMLIGVDGDPQKPLTSYLPDGTLAANTWYRVTAKVSDLVSGPYRQVTFKNESTSKYSFHVDQVRFQVDHAPPALRVTAQPPVPQPTVEAPIFGPTTCTSLARVDRTVTGSGASDEYRWSDRACGARATALVRADAKGGNAVEFRYPVNGATRTVPMSPETNSDGTIDAGGFGYVVSHLTDSDVSWRHDQDDSPLGSSLGNGYSVLFQGTHHAIHQYTVNYPRWGVSPSGVDTKYDMPVTIQWLFRTGSDAPVWSVTYDLSAVPAGSVSADMRAPYGSMNFDGAARGAWGDNLGGVAWADSYKFTSLATAGLTLNSPWTWSERNTGPAYNSVWTRTVDAEMGIVATHVIAKMDAGGYSWGNPGRGSSSAAGTRCTRDGGLNNLAHTMPCASDWAYQSANWSFWDANGHPTATGQTNAKRLAWGSDWGTLGQPTVTTVNGNVVTGSPKVSYSTFVVLDTHAKAPTAAAAAQVSTTVATTLTARTGSVRTSGPAGIGRTDTVTYSPAGYNPIFSTWELDASTAGTVDVQIDAPATAYLENPTFVVHGWTSTTAPSAVTLDGTAITAGTGYFASVRTATGDLWLTLNAKARGAGHRLVVSR